MWSKCQIGCRRISVPLIFLQSTRCELFIQVKAKGHLVVDEATSPCLAKKKDSLPRSLRSHQPFLSQEGNDLVKLIPIVRIKRTQFRVAWDKTACEAVRCVRFSFYKSRTLWISCDVFASVSEFCIETFFVFEHVIVSLILQLEIDPIQ